MHVHRSIGYLTAPAHVTTSGPQAAQKEGDQNGSGDAAEYSRIGPSCETLTPGRDRDSARFSEMYEFSEPSHLATGSGGQAMDYEVPLQSACMDNMKSTHISNIEMKCYDLKTGSHVL